MSGRDKAFYVGFTKDLKKRLDEHLENDAIAREKYFKTGFGRRFLRNRIKNYMDDEL
jgi:predicted GIY-YIG superfamily endonuclease